MTIDELLDKYEPKLAKAFRAAIDQINDGAQIGQIAKALEAGNLNAAVEYVYADRGAFSEFEAVLREAYAQGGAESLKELGDLKDATGAKFTIRFDGYNAIAVRWLAERSGTLITNIIQEQLAAIRSSLSASMATGTNPRTAALDIVGRMNKSSGRREGGIIGLSDAQRQAVERMRLELENGDFTAYLRRNRRDKRFDSVVIKARDSKGKISAANISRLSARYSDRLLNLRGETIARTETLASLHRSQSDAMQQLIDTGKIKASQIRRTWESAGDSRVRFSHIVMDGQSVGFGEPFITPRGREMLYPGDPNGGADEVIGCRCYVNQRISYLPVNR